MGKSGAASVGMSMVVDVGPCSRRPRRRLLSGVRRPALSATAGFVVAVAGLLPGSAGAVGSGSIVAQVEANGSPVASADVVTVGANTTVVVDVLANDNDPDGDDLAVTVESAPANGTATVVADTVGYVPDVNFYGSDSFDYRISDGRGGSSTATVSLTVITSPAQIAVISPSQFRDDVTFQIELRFVADLPLTHTPTEVSLIGGDRIYTFETDPMNDRGKVSVTLQRFSLPPGRYDVQLTVTDGVTPAAHVLVNGLVVLDGSSVADVTPPTVTVDQVTEQADPTDASPVEFDVAFSEPVDGFTAADVDLGGSTTDGTLTTSVTGGPTTFTVMVDVSGATADGTVVATIPAGVADDYFRNANEASTSTDNTVLFDVDTERPSVTVDQAVGQADPTASSPVLFTVVFAEPVDGFTDAAVQVGGTAGATTATVSGGPSTFTVAVSGMDTSGTVTASVAAGVVTDAAANPNTASTSADNTVTYDAPAKAEPLAISAAVDIVESNDPGEAGATVSFAPPSVSGGVAPVTVGCIPASGTFFALGTTEVVCSATDATGNSASSSFRVIVSTSPQASPETTTPTTPTTPTTATTPTTPTTPTLPTAPTTPPLIELPATGGSGGVLPLAAGLSMVGLVLLAAARTRPRIETR